MRAFARLLFILTLSFSALAQAATETVVIVHGISTGAYLADKFRAKGRELGQDLKIVHLQIGELPPEFAASYNPTSYDQTYKFSENDLSQVIRFLKTLNLKYSVVSGTENAVIFADHINEALGLAGNGTELTELKRNKEKLYMRLREMGINRAPFIGVSSAEEGMSSYEAAGLVFPMIVKPVDDAGGSGFHKVYSAEELKLALEKLFSPTTLTVFNTRISRVVIQTALVGPELAVQGAVLNGEMLFTDVIEYTKTNAVYERDLLADPTSPATLASVATAEKVLKATHIRNTPFHIEMIKDPRYGYVPIDVASRPMGGADHLMVKECVGYNQLDAVVESTLQPETFLRRAREWRMTGVPYTRMKSGCVLDFIQRQSGEVVRGPDIEFLKSLPTYLGHKSSLVLGSKVTVTTNMLNAGGMVWLAGPAEQIAADEKAFREYERSGQFIILKRCADALR